MGTEARRERIFLRDVEPLSAFNGRKVTVMGLGLFGGGKGLTEFLCSVGADVTVTDLRSREALAPVLSELEGLPVRWVLGEHREEDFTRTDMVFANPAVPRDSQLLALARRKGIPLETEMNLFFKHCPASICAITGSNGKTTTTSLAGAMARKVRRDALVGGNLGKSLLPDLASLKAGDWVVLEVSSFQLEDLASVDRRPDVAVVTNLSPNHLDRHVTYDAYLDAKRVILEPGPSACSAVLNGEDSLVRSWRSPARDTLFFGRTGSVVPRAPGVWLDEADGSVFLSRDGCRSRLFEARDLSLAGRFNVLNAGAASAAALMMGIEPGRIAEAIREFRPVEHRLEPVLERDGIIYLNDSIATTPESTVAALEALGPNAVFICGGSEKGCSFGALGRSLALRARGVVLLGKTADAIAAAIPKRPGAVEVRKAGTLEDAVAQASDMARPGDRVILSPACPSYDMFLNFAERGRRYKEIVRALGSSPS